MGIKYECKNNNCSYPGSTQFEIIFQPEAIMDHNNLAAIFCHFCKKKMLLSIPLDMANKLSVTRINA